MAEKSWTIFHEVRQRYRHARRLVRRILGEGRKQRTKKGETGRSDGLGRHERQY